MDESGAYRIRPAGRHLLTIGRELIQDSYAAVVELVKNAYDADSQCVDVCFMAKNDFSGYTVTIQDYGHGMSRDTVISKWMVPSTRDKLERKNSPKGRVMQGRKGVGRYAASVLGSDLLLETISADKEKTIVFVEWDSFENADYLDDVEILVESEKTSENTGTLLTITGDEQYLSEWNDKQFNKLRFELKKLISPTGTIVSKDTVDFEIKLKIFGFQDTPDVNETIEPYPIFDLYDYRISGKINADGKGNLNYSLQKAKNTVDDIVVIDLNKPTGCGDLIFDIRVYDREADAINSLINRGLKDKYGNYVGKLQARQLLNESNGIGVYRNGFRIRPLGDADFDWLKLNEQRVQNPSLRIGSNQAIGYVLIQSEEYSGLIEKSARDGLRENLSYENLKSITRNIIGKLEERRFSYRRKAGLSRSALKVERELEKLFSFDSLKKEIKKKLLVGGMTEKAVNDVIDLITLEEETKANVADDIRKAVATYQGQATLGKIIHIVLHEGRRPLSYFKNEIPRISRFQQKFSDTGDNIYLDKMIDIVSGVRDNAIIFSDLFKRLDPLSTGNRAKKKLLNIKNEIIKTLDVFRHEMKINNISFEINSGSDVVLLAWPQDIQAVFANLIDNSIFWLKEVTRERKIVINIIDNNGNLDFIDFRDTGPGIECSLIKDEVIFEPEFSTKPDGTGIGLAIAGEASARNNLELNVLDSAVGAYFRLQVKDINND
ncbi:TPA: ATP-binding protein [Morganella morganii subsp. morganii]|uniref:ATP-binding protein n=1 Tax=Morganella morganii TaxID=582 RepID=A0AAU8ZIP6_MORMO|nr:ATP-binding protein [Morganella morganii]AWC92975.1 ATP-binding protein [Morganella morganii]EKW8488120.1 ATP-binding protein [Morganella morganii]HDU8694529.1 ATP-binding protein [Morganella morganii subsp. morganii]